MLRLTPNAVPQGCLAAVIFLGCLLMAAGLRALGRGRYAVLEKGRER